MAQNSNQHHSDGKKDRPKSNHQPGSSPPTGDALQQAQSQQKRRSPHQAADAFNREPQAENAGKSTSE